MATTFSQRTINEIFAMPPEQLLMEMHENFKTTIPISIETIRDMENAGRLLGRYASEYSYLSNMAMLAKLKKRTLKQDKADKKIIEDALSREEIFSNFADIAKSSYNAISRMITVKQQINDELKMTDGK